MIDLVQVCLFAVYHDQTDMRKNKKSGGERESLSADKIRSDP